MNQPLPLQRKESPEASEQAAQPLPLFRVALLSILGFWTVYFALATARAAVNDMPAQGEMIVRRLVVTLIAMGLTGLLCLIIHRYRAASTGRLITVAVVASVPITLAYAVVNHIAFYAFPIAEQMDMDDMSMRHKSSLTLIGSSALEWDFFILAFAVMWIAFLYAGKVREAERAAAGYARAAQEAELRALRYQVNPHFLFNTLNSLSSLVMRGRGEEAERMILNLSTFFRASLTREASEYVPLAEELRLQLLYLDIEKVRFPERLVVKVSVPETLMDALVPALILQPLVENAIKYGVSRSQRPVTLTIAADAVGERLELYVRDDGEAAGGSTLAEGCGVGLENVRQRLKANFGAAGTCVSGQPAAGGWLVRLGMPLFRA